MSSILEALRQIEHEQGASTHPLAAAPAADAARPWWVWGLAATAALAGVVSAVTFHHRAPVATTAPSDALPPSSPVAAPIAELPEVPARPAVAAERAKEVTPHVEVAVAVPSARSARRSSAPSGRTSDDTASVAARVRAPRVDRGGFYVESLSYGPVPSARSAVLVVGGERRVFHEGETRGDIAVQLIMQDRVYVAQKGSVFALEVRR